MSETGSAAIRLVGVSKRYGGQLALRPTDLEIGEGEFFCLLGPSGCGKTTTLNLIGGFVNASEGEIHIRDRRVDGLPPHRRSVNTVFQSYALFPHMTVRDNVGFGLKMARVATSEARGRVDEALRLVGLEAFGDRHVREQRIRLEDGVDAPPVRRQRLDPLVADPDLAGRRVDEPADQVERRRLSAPRRAEQAEELALADLEVRRTYRHLGAVVLRDVD
jgi:spermidine/putrescine transport system ATP-binding protein